MTVSVFVVAVASFVVGAAVVSYKRDKENSRKEWARWEKEGR